MKKLRPLLFASFIAFSILADAQKVGNGGNFSRQELRKFIDNLLPIMEHLIFNNHRATLFEILKGPLDIFDLNAQAFKSIGNYLVLVPKKNPNDGVPYCLIASTQIIQSVLDQRNVSLAVRATVFFQKLPRETQKILAATYDQAKAWEAQERSNNKNYDTVLISPNCDYEIR